MTKELSWCALPRHGLSWVWVTSPGSKATQVKAGVTTRLSRSGNYNVMSPYQHADAMHKNVLTTAARKTVIIPTHLLTRQSGARGITIIGKYMKDVPKPTTTLLFYAKCCSSHFSLVRSNRFNPTVNTKGRGIYSLMGIALIPLTGPWQIKQGPFPTFPITSKSLRQFSSHRHWYQ